MSRLVSIETIQMTSVTIIFSSNIYMYFFHCHLFLHSLLCALFPSEKRSTFVTYRWYCQECVFVYIILCIKRTIKYFPRKTSLLRTYYFEYVIFFEGWQSLGLEGFFMYVSDEDGDECVSFGVGIRKTLYCTHTGEKREKRGRECEMYAKSESTRTGSSETTA